MDDMNLGEDWVRCIWQWICKNTPEPRFVFCFFVCICRCNGIFLHSLLSFETHNFVELVRKMCGIKTFYEVASEASPFSGYSIWMPTAICVLGEGEKKGEHLSEIDREWERKRDVKIVNTPKYGMDTTSFPCPLALEIYSVKESVWATMIMLGALY